MQAESNGKITVPYPCEDLQLDKTVSHQGNDEHVPMLSRSAVLLRRGVADYAISGGIGELNETGSIGHLITGRGHEAPFNTDAHSVELLAGDACGQGQAQQCDCIAALQPVLSHYATRDSMRTYDPPGRTTARCVPVGNMRNPTVIYGELPRPQNSVHLDENGTLQRQQNTPSTQPNSQNTRPTTPRPPQGCAGENLPDPDLVTVTLYSTNAGGVKQPNNNSVKIDNDSNSLREQRGTTFAKS